MNEKIEKLIQEMTLEEKVALLAGADHWTTVPVERLGIPALKVTDGPNGARGSQASGGPASLCTPVGVALAATWNPELVERVGMALGEEVRAKGAHVLLAPTVNIHRSPLAGRNFECYSEDPYLSGRIASAYIQGVQRRGVGACIKHFVCNDSEFERHTISSEVRERALREIYLTPFRMAIRDAKPWAVMSAYNRVNGTYCSENSYLLLDILKGDWGFDGLVISDWYGTYSEAVIGNGLDLEMPGPARWMDERAQKAVEAGAVSQAVIDDSVRRLLRTLNKAGAFEQPELLPEQAIDKPAHRRLVREAAAEAIVLLKNDRDILPLNPDQLNSLAVIGENAKRAQIQGGGSARVTPHYVVSPLKGIQNRVGEKVQLGYEIGCALHRLLPLIDVDWLTADDGEHGGLTAEYFGNKDLAGEPVHVERINTTRLVWTGDVAPGLDPERFSLRLSGTFTAPETGTFSFSLTSLGLSRLFLDGAEVIDNWTTPIASEERVATLELQAGHAYPVTVEYSWMGEPRWRMLRLGCLPPLSPKPVDDAVALAAQSDAVVLFAGLTEEWETEGSDRRDMELPGDQEELIRRVAAVNPNTVVVLNAGAPVTMDWLEKVPAVVQAWYPGQEAGNAIADVLFGDVDPSGRLPLTFPKRLQDNPAYINYPGENGQVHYGEGIFVGYRYYDHKEIEPLFPFGYGLSYTTFAYTNLTLNATEFVPEDEIKIGVDVENTGSLTGKEVVQLYIRDVASSLTRPAKELKAFAKVALQPGESRTVTFTLDPAALSFYDPAQERWVAEPGEFQVLVGSSSRDIRLTGHFRLAASEPMGRLHIGLPLRTILEDEEGKAVLAKHIPTILTHPQLSMALGMSLQQIAQFVPEILTPEILWRINEDLATV